MGSNNSQLFCMVILSNTQINCTIYVVLLEMVLDSGIFLTLNTTQHECGYMISSTSCIKKAKMPEASCGFYKNYLDCHHYLYCSSCSTSQFLDSWGSINFFSPRQEFNQDDIVLNYRDPDGDLIRLLSDQDVELMVSQSRRSPSEKHFFPWKLHITHKDDLSVYNTSPGTDATEKQ